MDPKGRARFWSIVLVVAVLSGAILWGIWPQGKSFEEATGLEHWELWLAMKAKAVNEWWPSILRRFR